MKAGIDYIGVGVVLVCHDGNGRLFLNKRSKKCRDEWGRWDNCGGAMEFGETSDEAMRRELMEEYGCRPVSWQRGEVVEMRKVNEKNEAVHWVHLTFLVEINPDEAHNNEQHKFEEVRWFALDSLPEPRHSWFERDWRAIEQAWSEFYDNKSL